MTKDLTLPELGEGLTTAVVLKVLVAEGDRLDEEQPVLELENEKATAELPSPFAGTVTEILVAEDDEIEVGQTVMKVEVEGESAEEEPEAEREAREDEPESSGDESADEPGEEPEEELDQKSKDREEEPEEEPEEELEEEPGGEPGGEPRQPRLVRPGPGGPVAPEGPETSPEGYVPAGPASRRLARELGLDISAVAGSGPGGRISLDDVKAAAREVITSRRRRPPAAEPEAPERPEPERWGPVSRRTQGTVRRKTAEAMTRSWALIPMVTHHDRADIGELEAQRERFKGMVEEAGGRLTLTAVVVKVVAAAVRVHPSFNAVYDADNDAVITRDYVNVAFAVDTEHGLLVPVIRDVDRKSTVQIALELGELARRARDRKLDLEQLQGAGITVSNVGGLGTTDFSPIVNWPQVAILGVGRAVTEAVWTGDEFSPRPILPLSLTYDHRVNDGADASRFLRWIAEALESPLKLVMEPAGD